MKSHKYPSLNSVTFGQAMGKCMIVSYIINNVLIDTANTLREIARRMCFFVFILPMLMEQTIFTKTILFDFVFGRLSLTFMRFENILLD